MSVPVFVSVDAAKLDRRRFSARVERMWSEPSHCSTQEEEAEAYTAIRERALAAGAPGFSARSHRHVRKCSAQGPGHEKWHTLKPTDS